MLTIKVITIHNVNSNNDNSNVSNHLENMIIQLYIYIGICLIPTQHHDHLKEQFM